MLPRNFIPVYFIHKTSRILTEEPINEEAIKAFNEAALNLKKDVLSDFVYFPRSLIDHDTEKTTNHFAVAANAVNLEQIDFLLGDKTKAAKSDSHAYVALLEVNEPDDAKHFQQFQQNWLANKNKSNSLVLGSIFDKHEKDKKKNELKNEMDKEFASLNKNWQSDNERHVAKVKQWLADKKDETLMKEKAQLFADIDEQVKQFKGDKIAKRKELEKKAETAFQQFQKDWMDHNTSYMGKVQDIFPGQTIRVAAILDWTTSGETAEFQNRKLFVFPGKNETLQGLAEDYAHRIYSLFLQSGFTQGEVLKETVFPVYFVSEKTLDNGKIHFSFKNQYETDSIGMPLPPFVRENIANENLSFSLLHMIVESNKTGDQLAHSIESRQGLVPHTWFDPSYSSREFPVPQFHKAFSLAREKKSKENKPVYVVTHILDDRQSQRYADKLAASNTARPERNETEKLELSPGSKLLSIVNTDSLETFINLNVGEDYLPALDVLSESIHFATRQASTPDEALAAINKQITLNFIRAPHVVVEEKQSQPLPKPEPSAPLPNDAVAPNLTLSGSESDSKADEKTSLSNSSLLESKETDDMDEPGEMTDTAMMPLPPQIYKEPPEVFHLSLTVKKSQQSFSPFEVMSGKKINDKIAMPLSHLALEGELNRHFMTFLFAEADFKTEYNFNLSLRCDASRHPTEQNAKFLEIKTTPASINVTQRPEHLIFVLDHVTCEPSVIDALRKMLHFKSKQNPNTFVSVILNDGRFAIFKQSISAHPKTTIAENNKKLLTVSEPSLDEQLQKLSCSHSNVIALDYICSRNLIKENAIKIPNILTKLCFFVGINTVNYVTLFKEQKEDSFAKAFTSQILQQFPDNADVLTIARIVKSSTDVTNKKLHASEQASSCEDLAKEIAHIGLSIGESVPLNIEVYDDLHEPPIDNEKIDLNDLAYGESQLILLVPESKNSSNTLTVKFTTPETENVTLSVAQVKSSSLQHNKPAQTIVESQHPVSAIDVEFKLEELNLKDESIVAYYRNEKNMSLNKLESPELKIHELRKFIRSPMKLLFPDTTKWSKSVSDFFAELEKELQHWCKESQKSKVAIPSANVAPVKEPSVSDASAPKQNSLVFSNSAGATQPGSQKPVFFGGSHYRRRNNGIRKTIEPTAPTFGKR